MKIEKEFREMTIAEIIAAARSTASEVTTNAVKGVSDRDLEQVAWFARALESRLVYIDGLRK